MNITKAEFIQILDERLELKLEEKLELKLNQKLDEKLDQKFAIHAADMKKFIASQIDGLAFMVKRGFDGTDIQFSQVNSRLDALEGKSFKRGWVSRHK